MRFAVRSTEKNYEAKWWLEDGDNHIFRFELDENTVPAWRLAIRKLPDNLILDRQSFRDCQFFHNLANPKDEDYDEAILERIAFCKFVLAFSREREDIPLALEILKNHPEIARFARQSPYLLLFLNQNDEGLDDEEASSRWKLFLEQQYQLNQSDTSWVADLVSHYDVLRELAYLRKKEDPKKAQLIGRNYAAVVKGILGFLEITAHSARTSLANSSNVDSSNTVRRSFEKYSPYLRTLLVENETLDLNERQEHLDSILAYPMAGSERSALLRIVLFDLKEDVREYPENSDAMETIASLMAQYYLNRYDLDQAITIWDEVSREQKDKVLRTILQFYRFPPCSIVTFLLILFALSLIPVIGCYVAITVLLISFLAFGLGLAAIIVRFYRKQGFSYLELFLPRLLGSTVVGLSILALESTVWEITLDMGWGNWLLTTLAASLGSLAYLFLDVHKNTRLLPDGLDSDGTGEKKARLTLMGRSIQTTFRIFAIGLLEAFVFTTIVSALIPFNSLGETFQSWVEKGSILSGWAGVILKVLPNNGLPGNVFILELFGTNGLTLAYFPKLIVLWTGLSLLIGAFVQLLWQDRHITAS